MERAVINAELERDPLLKVKIPRAKILDVTYLVCSKSLNLILEHRIVWWIRIYMPRKLKLGEEVKGCGNSHDLHVAASLRILEHRD
jgi:hypothetical protein